MTNIEFMKLKPKINNFSKFPQPAIMGTASWWKDMPKYDLSDFPYPKRNHGTVRACPAVSDSVNFGYILYFPVDVFIDASNEKEIRWDLPDVDLSIFDDQDQKTFMHFHGQDQVSNYPKNNIYHPIPLKINSLWGIKTSPGYSVWITSPVLRNDLPFKIVDAIIDTDKFMAIFPYTLFVKAGFSGVIKSGTPLMQVIPFKREDFSHSIIEKDIEDMDVARKSILGMFSGAYKKIHWSKKKFS